jgi:hypothetical protein
MGVQNWKLDVSFFRVVLVMQEAEGSTHPKLLKISARDIHNQ